MSFAFRQFSGLVVCFLQKWEKWMGNACVRGRLCNTPGHWGRTLIRFPPSAEELPHDFEQAFWNGWPWIFSNESRWFSNDE